MADFRLFESGKPEGARAVDRPFALEAGKLSLGGAGCDVVLPGLSAGTAAEIAVVAGAVSLKRTGDPRVLVGGREVQKGTEIALAVETLLSVGGVELVFRATGPSAAKPSEPDSERPSIMAKDVLKQVYAALGVPEGDRPALIVYDEQEKLVKRLDLGPGEEEVTIGRGSGNRLVLYHEMVSKNHARVVRDGVGFLVCDLESRNGVEVNGSRVRGKARLKSGDRVRIGAFTIRFVDPRAQLSDSLPDLDKIEKAKPGEKVEVGRKSPELEGMQSRTQPPAKPATSPAAVPSPPPAVAVSAPAPRQTVKGPDPSSGPGLLVYVLIGVGALILAGAVVLIVIARRT